MLDGDNFLKAGWINELRLHQFHFKDGIKFVVMGKVLCKVLEEKGLFSVIGYNIFV